MEAYGEGMGGEPLTSKPIYFEGPWWVVLPCFKHHNSRLFLSASKVSEIRLRLAQEEAAEAEKGQRLPHQVSPSIFIRNGLDIEDQQ